MRGNIILTHAKTGKIIGTLCGEDYGMGVDYTHPLQSFGAGDKLSYSGQVYVVVDRIALIEDSKRTLTPHNNAMRWPTNDALMVHHIYLYLKEVK